MRTLLLSLSLALLSTLLIAQKPDIETNGINQLFELKDGGLLVVTNDVERYNKDFEKEFSVTIPDGMGDRKFFLSKSEEFVFGLRDESFGSFPLWRLFLTGAKVGEDFPPFISIAEKGWKLYAHFVSESHMNFLLMPEKSKKDGKVELRWVQYDRNLNKTEKKLILPSYNIKGNTIAKHKFMCENNGALVFVLNYIIKKTASEEGAKTVLLTVSSDGEIVKNDISKSIPICSFSHKMRNVGAYGVDFFYVEATNEIAYQVINEDKRASRFGLLTLEGEIKWERTVTFEKKYDIRLIVGAVYSFFSVLNNEFLVYNVGNPLTGIATLEVVTLEDGEKITGFEYEHTKIYSPPSKVYLTCMSNPDGKGAQVIKEIQESVKKTKHLRAFTMGYLTNGTSEYLWVTEKFLSKLYKFDIE